jgi:hypothetical protein
MSPIFQIAMDAMRLVPLRKQGEKFPDWENRVVAFQRQFNGRQIEPYAAALVRGAAILFEMKPESEKLKLTDVSIGGSSRADKNANQAQLMRKRRAAAKAAKLTAANGDA